MSLRPVQRLRINLALALSALAVATGAGAAAKNPDRLPRYDHVFVILEENKDADMILEHRIGKLDDWSRSAAEHKISRAENLVVPLVQMNHAAVNGFARIW